MTPQPPPVETLIDDYVALRIDRREFFKRAGAIGISMSAAGALLARVGSARSAGFAAAGPRKGGILREGYDRDVNRCDPVNTAWWDPSLYPALHETLIATDPNGKFVPMLAESWTVSPDGLEWTFILRKGLKFQSGAPFDAAAVAAAMRLFAKPPGTNFGFWAPVKSISAKGKRTVKVRFSHPYADFPYVLNNGYSAIFNVSARKKLGDNYGVKGTDGTGPFTLKEFMPGSHVLVKRWDSYQGTILPFFKNKGKALVDGIRWEVLPEPATRAKEIEAGNIDTLRGPAPQDVDRLKKNKNLAVIEFQEPSLYQLGVNFRNTELGFDDARVRQALSHAIDRKTIADKIFFGKADPAYTLIPSKAPYYDPSVEKFGTFNPDKAKALLDAAGWKVGSDGIRRKNGKKLSFKIIIEQDRTEALVTQAVQQMLRKVGVDMSFTEHGADYFTVLFKGPVGYMIKQLWTNVIDASLLFASSKYFIPACCNATYSKIPALDRALNDWQTASSESELRSASRRAQRISAEQLPFIPIVTPHVVWVHSKKVHGWLPSQSNLYPFYNDVWIEA